MDSRLEKLRESLASAVEGLSSEQLSWHLPGKWCAAEVLEHLYLTYTGTITGLERVIRKAKPLASRASMAQRLLTFVVVALGHMPAGRKAPTVVRPRGLPAEQVRNEIGAKLAAMDAIIAQCEARFGRRVKLLDHPLLGPLTATQWRKLHLVHETIGLIAGPSGLSHFDSVEPCRWICEPKHRKPLSPGLIVVTNIGDSCYRHFLLGRCKMRPAAGTIRQRERLQIGMLKGRTGMRRSAVSRPQLSPRCLRKAGRRGSCPPRTNHPRETTASVEALDERPVGFSTRRPGQGRKRLRAQAAVLLTPERGKSC
jgi:Protein of unknown function (DUF1569)